jgi:hypothetical protein
VRTLVTAWPLGWVLVHIKYKRGLEIVVTDISGGPSSTHFFSSISRFQYALAGLSSISNRLIAKW